MKLRRSQYSDGRLSHLLFRCPGCKDLHQVHPSPCPTPGPDGLPCKSPHWTFNGDYEKPTFSPSILVHGVYAKSGVEYVRPMAPGEVIIPKCHSFVKNGRIEFLADCDHELRGQAVDLPDWIVGF